MTGLFDSLPEAGPSKESLAPGAAILRGFALKNEPGLISGLHQVTARAPFRHMITPGGFRMSVAMTNCGALGWVTDKTGYRYDALDPESGERWPEMPACFLALATCAAEEAGFRHFVPDACLVNRYEAGARLTLHQDKNERDFAQPIVSVSLGIPAVFLFGGFSRSDEARRLHVVHGDVMAWGGPARLRYHGVMPLKEDYHRSLGPYRFNLTFRKAA
jgi:alkylated DNA repair protein (DNA oxidative demethylase)